MSGTAEKRPLLRMHPLEFPVTVNGVKYTEIPIRRLTARQVADWYEHIRVLAASNPEAPTPDLPMIDAPREVLDQLDDDDMLALEEASNDFLPRRLRITRRADDGNVSSPETGKASAPSFAVT